jgi:hypothetical protein
MTYNAPVNPTFDLPLILESYATGAVESTSDDAGGFLGSGGGQIMNSYATGSVTADAKAGGFVADQRDALTITQAYSTGSVQSATTGESGFAAEAINLLQGAYWNLDSSGNSTDEGGATGYESAQAMLAETYSGWMISDSPRDSEAIWVLCPGITEAGPVLAFQLPMTNQLCGSTEELEVPPQVFDAGGQALNFSLPYSVGAFSGQGFTWTYRNVIESSVWPIDATVSVNSASLVDAYYCSEIDLPNNLIRHLDSYSSDDELNRWLRLQLDDICLDDESEGSVDISVSFSIRGTPVELQNLTLAVYDLDDMQFLEVSGFDRYQLTADSIISARVVDGITRFEETQDLSTSNSSTTDDFDFIGSALTVGRVQMEFDQVGRIDLRLGAAKDGAAYFDLDFSAGNPWQDENGEAELVTIANPVSDVQSATTYDGPVITGVSKSRISSAGDTFDIFGSTLDSVSKISVDGKPLSILSKTSTQISVSSPSGLSLGVRDLEIESSFGLLRAQGLLQVVLGAAATDGVVAWTSLKSDFVKVYAKNVVSAGKVNFFLNGKEVAWIRADSNSHPKLRVSGGVGYLVRSLELKTGKNVIEVYVDGERILRRAYTQR